MPSEIENYDFQLPKELIAQHPRAQRSDARIMVVDRSKQTVEHNHFRDLPGLLRRGDCLVFNDSKVVPARLVGHRQSTRGNWEGLFLRESGGTWQLLCKTRGRLHPNELIVLHDRVAQDDISLQLMTNLGDGTWVARPESNEPWTRVLDRVGRVPLPHYIRGGKMVDADIASYQTTFASRPGSVAAPTAGLHFTPRLIERLVAAGIDHAFVTLHVGLGTFRPIAAKSLDDHEMHAEWGCITPDTSEKLNATRAAGGRIVAVGTTSVRVLESATAAGRLQPWQGETGLFIRPPYEFRNVDMLITNFHLPRSTLLVLVRCFGGDGLIRRAYTEAIADNYRFFSYGDAMLIK